jgi:hypothetical protein
MLFLDEAECRLWSWMPFVEVGTGVSRLAARRGFYSHDPELEGSAWIELQNGSKDH